MNSKPSDDFRFTIHATANARHNAIGGCHDRALRVSVTAAPEKGKANKAIVKLLAKALSVSRSQIEIVGGQTNRRKTFLVSGPPDDIAARIEMLSCDDGSGLKGAKGTVAD